jgi:hypothetical protein
MRKYYVYVADYVTYLQNERIMTPSTICGHLDALFHYFKWVAWHSDKRTSFKDDPITCVGDLIRSCRRQALKQRRRDESDRSMRVQVVNMSLPPDGFQGLLRILDGRTQWAFSCKDISAIDIDKRIYDDYLSVMFSNLYCKVPQGRVGGLMNIKLWQFTEIESQGHTMSTKFKTMSKYGLQPVVVDGEICNMIRIYVERFRPVAILNNDACDYLWLTFKGEQVHRMGSYVTRFFEKHGNLHVTTTGLRSLAETTSNRAWAEGKLSMAEKEAITSINGHSSQVTRDYYVRTDQAKETTLGRSGFKRMLGIDDADTVEDLWPKRDVVIVPQYGASHPHIQKKTERAYWSDAEIGYVGSWCSKQRQRFPETNRILTKLLDHIRRTPKIHRIFHPRHVLNTSRLRQGLAHYERRLALVQSKEVAV